MSGIRYPSPQVLLFSEVITRIHGTFERGIYSEALLRLLLRGNEGRLMDDALAHRKYLYSFAKDAVHLYNIYFVSYSSNSSRLIVHLPVYNGSQ
jgi:hypothetical protein